MVPWSDRFTAEPFDAAATRPGAETRRSTSSFKDGNAPEVPGIAIFVGIDEEKTKDDLRTRPCHIV